jgi:predicted HTH transcriptional regulator
VADYLLSETLRELISLPGETEWVEFKHNDSRHSEIGEYLSAIANSAALLRQTRGWIVWGVEDGTRRVVGTTFRPRQERVGNEELENWLVRALTPRVDLRIHELNSDGSHVVLFEIPAARHTPVRFGETEFIRVGTYKKRLRDYPEKERSLWALLSRETFESGVAVRGASADQVLELVDYTSFFELVGTPLPENREAIVGRLLQENVISRVADGFDISNLGALLFGRQLARFEHLGRKAVRVIQYSGRDRTRALWEQEGSRGYAVGFQRLVEFVIDRLPRNEEIDRALRREVTLYPPIAVRELTANALIHQDLMVGGSGPMLEIFEDRIEFTNPGVPLIDPLRFIDEPPRSRNEALAAMMRRLKICEERGSGVDKVIGAIELYQLPPLAIRVTSSNTQVVLFAPRRLSAMDRDERIRACYQHAVLCWLGNRPMTNTSLRARLGIEDRNYSMASRIISETVRAGVIKAADPESSSRRHARYVPFWL